MHCRHDDESELAAQKIQNEELKEEIDRLNTQLQTKNQELFNCRMTVAEFSLLLPRLEEQQRRSTAELKQAIKRYEELRKEMVTTEGKLMDKRDNE
uniref:Uncharacterized protein n=1 Tax=Panagrolaimus sp. PS1159 TaxID=55785 RepID=A0AC35FKG6_9BILA